MADPRCDTKAPAFDEYAGGYDEALGRGLSLTGEGKEYYARERVRRLAELLTPGAPGRILDYGCGTGGAIPWLRAAFPGARVWGTDVSEASLELARQENPDAEFVSMSSCPGPEGIDLCHCNGVFHHIPPVERDACLDSIRTSLAVGGRLALFENNPFNPGTRLVMSRIPFDRDAITLTPQEAVRRVRRAGLELLRVEFLFFFPRALAVLRPLEAGLRRVPVGGQYLVLARRTG